MNHSFPSVYLLPLTHFGFGRPSLLIVCTIGRALEKAQCHSHMSPWFKRITQESLGALWETGCWLSVWRSGLFIVFYAVCDQCRWFKAAALPWTHKCHADFLTAIRTLFLCGELQEATWRLVQFSISELVWNKDDQILLKKRRGVENVNIYQ